MFFNFTEGLNWLHSQNIFIITVVVFLRYLKNIGQPEFFYWDKNMYLRLSQVCWFWIYDENCPNKSEFCTMHNIYTHTYRHTYIHIHTHTHKCRSAKSLHLHPFTLKCLVKNFLKDNNTIWCKKNVTKLKACIFLNQRIDFW